MVAGSRVSRVVLFSVVSVFVAAATVSSQAATLVPDQATPSSTAPEVNPSPCPALAAPAPTDPQSEHMRSALATVISITALDRRALLGCGIVVVAARFCEGSK